MDRAQSGESSITYMRYGQPRYRRCVSMGAEMNISSDLHSQPFLTRAYSLQNVMFLVLYHDFSQHRSDIRITFVSYINLLVPRNLLIIPSLSITLSQPSSPAQICSSLSRPCSLRSPSSSLSPLRQYLQRKERRMVATIASLFFRVVQSTLSAVETFVCLGCVTFLYFRDALSR